MRESKSMEYYECRTGTPGKTHRKDEGTMKIEFDIQRFAEGGAAGGAAAAAAGSADAGQSTGAQTGETGAQGQDAAAVDQGEPGKNQEKEPRDLHAEFERMVKGEYKAEFDARVQKIINRRFAGAKAAEEANGKMQGAMDVLAQRYGLDGRDYEGILNALNRDQELYENEAAREGMDVGQLMRMKQLERENAALTRQQEQAKEEQKVQQAYRQMMQEADSVKAQYPGFDINEEMADENFVRMMRAGVPLKTCYEVAHHDEIISGAMQYTAQKVAEKVSAGIASNRNRPAENGGAGTPAAKPVTDVEHMTRAQRQALARRAANGERIEL